MNKRLLLIFVKNPTFGKVKTRLAETIGKARALQVYHYLLGHTRTVALGADCDRAVFYSDFVESKDIWEADNFTKFAQTGEDLGERMANGFREAFRLGYESVVVIGSDCLEITSDYLNQAFAALEKDEAVIGPAKDGGYVLLGMKKFHAEFFQDKPWSTAEVFPKTLGNMKELGLSYSVLLTLSDVDYEEDLAHLNINDL